MNQLIFVVFAGVQSGALQGPAPFQTSQFGASSGGGGGTVVQMTTLSSTAGGTMAIP